jgi:RNA polymerase sigma-70 factor (ECF subfamily)
MADQFQELLLQHLPRLQGYAMMLVRNRSAAEDLLQETALRALGAQHQFAIGTNFTAWIYKILRNEYINSLRRGKRTPVPIEDVPLEFLVRPGNQESDVLRGEIFRAMNKLPFDQREALILTYAGGLSYEEAAEAMDCAVGTVKSRLWRARAQMAHLMLGEARSIPIIEERKMPDALAVGAPSGCQRHPLGSKPSTEEINNAEHP